jgi:hypothetical protein
MTDQKNKEDPGKAPDHCKETEHEWIGYGEEAGIKYEQCARCSLIREAPACALASDGKHQWKHYVLKPPMADHITTEIGDYEEVEVCELCGEERPCQLQQTSESKLPA